ncbi:MAG: hypothetical protein J6S95_05040 [Lachnospiraceae bacterium]|nr:hypothetical protein [Lachnospiraceae bacterium]MBO7600497.1 hypothetical protein [Lachnospiraceae bacterium]
MDFKYKAIDVICQHTKEGNIIPLKIRIKDEEGEYQAFLVRAYKDLSKRGKFTLPNGIIATNDILPFACKIAVFGRERVINIYYNRNDNIWRLSG